MRVETSLQSFQSKKKAYDSTECFREKFNEIGSIQDELGCIISLKYAESSGSYVITSVSENVSLMESVIREKKPLELLGRQLTDVFEKEIANIITGLIHRFQSIKNVDTPVCQPRICQVLPVLCKGTHIKVHDSLICCSMVSTSTNDEFILELEEVKEDIRYEKNPRILHSGNTMSQIRGADSIDSVISTYIDYVMSLCPCYDRGMAYRFLDDDSGEVIYENIRDPAVVPESYLYLRFPAEDIPPLIRQIYLKNGIRIICNTNGSNSKVMRSDSSPLDLTMSAFRSCSHHHIKYLHQMGVIGALSIAICVNDKLWGLYIFHSHTGSVRPSVEERIMFEMIGSITSVKISAFESENIVKLKSEMNRISRLLQNQDEKRIQSFLDMSGLQLLQLLDAHAVIVYSPTDGTYSMCGDDSILPNEYGIEKLKILSFENSLLAIDSFSEGLNGIGAGVLFYRHQYAHVAFIRKSKIHDIKWGGVNENLPNYVEIPRLHPNSSFRIYYEKARKESKYWTQADGEVAEQIIDCFIQCLNSEVLSTFKSELEQSNAECVQVMKSAKENYEFFAHMSHELRTPFHGVISSLQVLHSGEENLSKLERKEIIESALECGKVMLRTLDDILTIAKNKHNVELAHFPFFMSAVFTSTRQTMIRMAEVKSIELQSEVIESKLVLDINDLKTKMTDETELATLVTHDNEVIMADKETFSKFVVLGDQTRIGQICNNLTNNAIKFTPSGGNVTMKSAVVSSIDGVNKIWESHKNEYRDSYVYRDHLIKDVDCNTVFFVYIVKDTGCGMTNEDLPSIFEAYKQVSSGVTKTYQGKGLPDDGPA